MIRLHTVYTHTPQDVRVVERATGMTAVVRNGIPILITPPARRTAGPSAAPDADRASGAFGARVISPNPGATFDRGAGD